MSEVVFSSLWENVLAHDNIFAKKVDQIKGYLEDWMYCKNPGENIKDVGKCIDMMERYLIPAFKVN